MVKLYKVLPVNMNRNLGLPKRNRLDFYFSYPGWQFELFFIRIEYFQLQHGVQECDVVPIEGDHAVTSFSGKNT